MGPNGSTFGVQYVQQSIRFASELNCPSVDTTDGAFEIGGLSREEVFRITCDNYRQCLSWAEEYRIMIAIEPHGPYTNDGDFMQRLFDYFDSEYLKFNFDTGNSFIAGHDPLEYCQRFRKYLVGAHQGRERFAGCGSTGRGDRDRQLAGAHRWGCQRGEHREGICVSGRE